MKSFLGSVVLGGVLLSTASSACVSDVEIITAEAPIALLIDADSGQILHSENPDRRFIPASITKIMSAYVAFEMIKNGSLSLDQNFSLSESAAEDWYRTGSTMFLEPGEEVPVDLLLRGITSVSANDASAVLAEGAGGSIEGWTDKMNTAAADLGMRSSHFATPNGWPDGGKTFTTANDLAKLSRALIRRHPDLYARYFGKEGLRHNGFAQANHDPISGVVEGADGIKTGYTGQAGHGFVGSVKRGDTRLLMVLGAIDEEATRAAMSRELIEWGFTEFDRTSIYAKGANVGSAKVQNGVLPSVGLVAAQDISIALPKDRNVTPKLSVRYAGPLEAPIQAGENVATLNLSYDGELKARIPLSAANDINEAGFLRRIANAFTGWFE